ncbi:MAG: hypothetical protein AUK29_09345 [Nitrospirae bacterium CG2_30_53_67]|nr:MAG: hypothetical protein AUK29_09345 [Nitrospirae bacterium CG2_30_53_67]
MKKSLKFLVDVGVGKNIESWLRSQEFDVLAVRDIDPRMRDSEILKLSTNEKRVVITMDKDFGELVYHHKQRHIGVLLLRMEDAGRDEKLSVVQKVLIEFGDLLADSFCTYQNGKFRIRK